MPPQPARQRQPNKPLPVPPQAPAQGAKPRPKPQVGAPAAQQQKGGIKIIKPENQLQLTEKQLDEEITRMLTANNPNAPDNLVVYSYKDSCYKSKGMVSQAEFHLQLDSLLVPNTAEQDIKPIGDDAGVGTDAAVGDDEENRDAENNEAAGKKLKNQFNFSVRGTQTFSAPPSSRQVSTEPPPNDIARGMISRSIIYDAYKANEALNNTNKETKIKIGHKEEKTNSLEFADVDKQNIAGMNGQAHTASGTTNSSSNNTNASNAGTSATGNSTGSVPASLILPGSSRFPAKIEASLLRSLRLAERIVSECIGNNSEVITDFKYWDNPADEYSAGEGSLLPLWQFNMIGGNAMAHMNNVGTGDNTSGINSTMIGPNVTQTGANLNTTNMQSSTTFSAKSVCSIQWHPIYKDVFAVSYGNMNFINSANSPSKICIYTLMDPVYPEIVIPTPCDCLCIDWYKSGGSHIGVPNMLPQTTEPSLLCAGFADGTVAVYEIRHKKEDEMSEEWKASGSQGSGNSSQITSQSADMYMSPNRQYTNGRSFTLIAHSTADTGKHLDPVWDITWGNTANTQSTTIDTNKDNAGSDSNTSTVVRGRTFYSASSDGTVRGWSMLRGELRMTSVMEMRQPVVTDSPLSEIANIAITTGKDSSKPTGTERNNTMECSTNALSPLSGVLCLRFSTSPQTPWLYTVGTDTGPIRVCSTAYTAHYMQSMIGHSLPVVGMDFSPFDPTLILSCSEDWTIRLWCRERSAPLATWDLGMPISDVRWSPHVSSVFACVGGGIGGDGIVFVFDVAQDRRQPICKQQLLTAGVRPTRLVFSKKYPVLLIGDSSGCVHCLKLSPNLRKVTEPRKPKTIPGQPPPPPLTEEEQSRMIQQGEIAKLKEFIDFAIQNNKSAGIE